jgi:hypothetical protein
LTNFDVVKCRNEAFTLDFRMYLEVCCDPGKKSIRRIGGDPQRAGGNMSLGGNEIGRWVKRARGEWSGGCL